MTTFKAVVARRAGERTVISTRTTCGLIFLGESLSRYVLIQKPAEKSGQMSSWLYMSSVFGTTDVKLRPQMNVPSLASSTCDW